MRNQLVNYGIFCALTANMSAWDCAIVSVENRYSVNNFELELHVREVAIVCTRCMRPVTAVYAMPDDCSGSTACCNASVRVCVCDKTLPREMLKLVFVLFS
jgi:hypothetical protein